VGVLTLRLTESIGKMLDICSELREGCKKSVPQDKLHAVLMAYVIVVVWLTQQEHLLVYLSLANQDVVERYLGDLSQYCKKVANATVVDRMLLLVSHVCPFLPRHILIALVFRFSVRKKTPKLESWSHRL
jgi:hypothetical protein